MQHVLAKLVVIGFLLVAQSLALAAPKSLTVTYEATRNGQPFANITETFTQQDGKYRIESETRGIGVYALFGVRRLLSEGEVGPSGLKPLHFELHQGAEAKRSLFADFDWPGNQLNMKVKGKLVTAELKPGAQDIASLVYQFMFVQPKGESFKLPVTTGKRLKRYEYRVAGRNEPVTVPAGSYKTVHLQDAAENADEDSKELWLGDASVYFLPVKLVTRDDKGDIEQVLTGLHAE
ncbi:MAG: DUF3108 domain-containing protein [Betaproteobacteria bacterium HGW-Betaproteobacteria-1]|jgi:hypothetical protein|nr:MAG: DUF3108 domain-containing protein [Betaproteobacteria bacterium HGW-Betaproteobacteria-1]